MELQREADVAIIGAGIVGLAHAYMALRKGYSVVLFERDEFAVGASIRNFGLIWPVGQLPGEGLTRALRSREHWVELAGKAGFWINQNGSMHVAYSKDEMVVLEEFCELHKDHEYTVQLLTPDEISGKSQVVNRQGLVGGLFSASECTVFSRQAIRKLPGWLNEEFGCVLRFGKNVQEISYPYLYTTDESWRVNHIVVCSGNDFQTLYPHLFDKQLITRCKLQMLRAVFNNAPVDIGPSLCSGLTLRHYASFSVCPSLPLLDARYDAENPDYKKFGIHVLVAQNQASELIIGDSHDYALTHEPFDSEYINNLILNYLSKFLPTDRIRIVERWHGIYPKLLTGKLDMVVKPEHGVTVVTGLGGAGMTLSFGLAEEVIAAL